MESLESLFDDVHGLEPLFHAQHPEGALPDSLLYQVVYPYLLFPPRIPDALLFTPPPSLLDHSTLPSIPLAHEQPSALSPLCPPHPVNISRAVSICFSSQAVNGSHL